MTIFLDPGTPLPIFGGGGQLPPPVPLQGVPPGTALVARVHVNAVQTGEGIAGPFSVYLLNPDGSVGQTWNVSSVEFGGHVDIPFISTLPAGSYRMIAKFHGSTRTGPDGVTTIYSPSSGERSFLVVVPNLPPIANAGPDQVLFRTSAAGVLATLDGSASSDPEGFPLQFAWFEQFGVNPEQLIGTGATIQHAFALGPHNIRLRVTDAGGIVRSDFVSVQVNNVAPVANAGPDQTRECVVGGVVATLNGSGSDLDGTIAGYKWFGLGNPAGVTGQSVQTFPMSVGEVQFTLEVTDNNGARAIDHVRVRVEDTQGPTIQMVVSPTRLWTPNHEMVKVVSGASATDACGSSNVFGITVTSNEPLNGPGDGNTDVDWNVVNNGDGTYNVFVRAERAAGGTGRVYTIMARAVDGTGNVSTQTATVEVPHNN